jgi:hypothetical protein
MEQTGKNTLKPTINKMKTLLTILLFFTSVFAIAQSTVTKTVNVGISNTIRLIKDTTGNAGATTLFQHNKTRDSLGVLIAAGSGGSNVGDSVKKNTDTLVQHKLQIGALNAGKEPIIASGSAAQYIKGDKSLGTLDKAAVGLSNVDNTSDATKNAAPVTLTNKTLAAPIVTGQANVPIATTTSAPVNLQQLADSSKKDQLFIGDGLWMDTATISGTFRATIKVLGSTAVITSGTAYTVADTITRVLTNPSALLSTFTYTLPANPQDGQRVSFNFGGAIANGLSVVSTLSIVPNSGQTISQWFTPFSTVSGDNVSYYYIKAITRWQRN